jgi:PEP-CTERM motif
MKKFLLILFAGFVMWGAPAVADTLLSEGLYGGDLGGYNPVAPVLMGDENAQALVDDENLEKWLEGLLNLEYDDPSIFEVDSNADDWLYAVVKWQEEPQTTLLYTDDFIREGTWWYAAFVDDGDGLLDIAFYNDHGISPNNIDSVAYFAAAPVPEPSTMLLLGSGMIGLAGMARRKFKRQ